MNTHVSRHFLTLGYPCQYPWNSPLVVALIVIGVVIFTLFIFIELKVHMSTPHAHKHTHTLILTHAHMHTRRRAHKHTHKPHKSRRIMHSYVLSMYVCLSICLCICLPAGGDEPYLDSPSLFDTQCCPVHRHVVHGRLADVW